MKFDDPRLRVLNQALGRPVLGGRWRGIDTAEIREALADLSDAVRLREQTRRSRTAQAPWVMLGLGLAGLAGGAAAFWLLRDEARRNEVQRNLNDVRASAATEVREAIQRGRSAAEQAASQLPIGADEANELLKQTADALDEAVRTLGAASQERLEKERAVGNAQEGKRRARENAPSRANVGEVKGNGTATP
jgi:hypothetical protein